MEATAAAAGVTKSVINKVEAIFASSLLTTLAYKRCNNYHYYNGDAVISEIRHLIYITNDS